MAKSSVSGYAKSKLKWTPIPSASKSYISAGKLSPPFNPTSQGRSSANAGSQNNKAMMMIMTFFMALFPYEFFMV